MLRTAKTERVGEERGTYCVTSANQRYEERGMERERLGGGGAGAGGGGGRERERRLGVGAHGIIVSLNDTYNSQFCGGLSEAVNNLAISRAHSGVALSSSRSANGHNTHVPV